MKISKLAFLSTVLMVGTVSVANAADVFAPESYPDTYEAEPVAYAPIAWAGFYFGGHIGSTFGSQFEANHATLEIDNALTGGVHLGYNWQTPSHYVFGVETDIGMVDDESPNDSSHTEFVTTLRGRLGYAMGDTLVYGTGGATWVGYDTNDDETFEDIGFGYVVGAGFEHKFGNNVSLGVESLYNEVTLESEVSDLELEQEFWAVRARASYHFGQRQARPLK
ncbi:MAG: outer membrane beta-barrel protein [Hyphomicrobiales bacterium]|nr:outer membrane beta-barrel protein [Hyphomicrobiales bacterium]